MASAAQRGLWADPRPSGAVGVAEEEIALVAGLFLGTGAFGFSLRGSQQDTDCRQ